MPKHRIISVPVVARTLDVTLPTRKEDDGSVTRYPFVVLFDTHEKKGGIVGKVFLSGDKPGTIQIEPYADGTARNLLDCYLIAMLEESDLDNALKVAQGAGLPETGTISNGGGRANP